MEFIFNNYHMNTKHTYLSIRTNPNRVNWNNPPNKFKFYSPEYKRVQLTSEFENYNFLYLIAGISAKKTYPDMEYYLRVNPSAGALYPNEIYFQARNVDGFEDGIYHFEVGSSSVVLLKELKKDEGIEQLLEVSYLVDGFIFFISSIYFRSSWKYKNRAFRYCLLDAGHIIGSMEASAYLYDKDFEVLYDFPKTRLNEFFSFDEKEFFSSIVIVGDKKEGKINIFEFKIPTLDGASYIEENISFFEKNGIVENAYKDSLKIVEKKKARK